jgi:multidrug efflux system membrane fusion protein
MQLKDNHKKSLIILAIILVWIVIGYVLPGNNEEEDNKPKDNKNSIELRIEKLTASERSKKISLVGVTEAFRKINIKAEIGGKVEEIVAAEGSFVNEGEIILKIEKRDKQARVEQQKALVKQKKIDFESAKKLAAKGLQSKANVAKAESELEEAKADLTLAEINLENTIIRAPFSGYIEKINVEVGDFVQSGFGGATQGDQGFGGEDITKIIDLDPFIVKAGVSERLASQIEKGMPAEIRLINGETISGEVTYKSRVASETTRTFDIEVTSEESRISVASGMTVNITIPVKTEIAHKVPSSSLFLNDAGEFGIKTLEVKEKIDENSVLGNVKFHKITVSDSDSDGIWISGLPNEINLITLGGAFVRVGQEAIGKYPQNTVFNNNPSAEVTANE